MSTILVADDDQRIALSICVRLRKAGHTVIDANDGVTAFKKIVEHKPDLVILDIGMPAGNGLTIAERIRENVDTALTPVLFITASRKAEFRQSAERWNPVAYFEKPFDADELMSCVERALQEHCV